MLSQKKIIQLGLKANKQKKWLNWLAPHKSGQRLIWLQGAKKYITQTVLAVRIRVVEEQVLAGLAAVGIAHHPRPFRDAVGVCAARLGVTRALIVVTSTYVGMGCRQGAPIVAEALQLGIDAAHRAALPVVHMSKRLGISEEPRLAHSSVVPCANCC